MFVLLAQFGSNFPTPDYDEIAAVMRGNGHIVWVATPNELGDLAVHDGADIVAILKKPVNLWGRLWSMPGISRLGKWLVEFRFAMRLRHFISRHKPDIVHLNRSKLIFFWVVPLWASNKTKHIIDWRQIGEREYGGPLGKIKRFIATQYRRTPSRHIYDQACFLHAEGARQVLGDQWQRWATVVPLAVSAQFLADHDPDLNMIAENTEVRFIYIGTLSRVRRLDRILLAAQRMGTQENGGKRFELSFIGPDKTSGKIQEMIDQLNLDSYVDVKPPVPYHDVPKTLDQYDVALAYVPEYPLDWQYHPTLKVLEYRAYGMPIIASDFAPNRELIEEGVNGLLVKNTPDNIAEAMRRFVNEEGFLKQCVENARSMRTALLWQDVSVMYEQLYLRLLSRRHS